MKLAILDQQQNEYVSKMWLAPLEQYALHHGVSVKRIMEPTPEFGWTMLCNAASLNRSLIQHFHDNRCPLVAISCNDSAYLTEQLQCPELALVPLVFTISGVQKTNFSQQSVMNADMSVACREVQFLPDEAWAIYDDMARSGRLLPLPYVPWDRLPEVSIPEHKNPSILFRGGNHFWRFVAYLHALKAGVAHPASGFLTQDYFSDSPEMQERFRYCEKCRREWNQNGKMLETFKDDTCECSADLNYDEPLKWNNRTPRAFGALATKMFPGMDQYPVYVALNFRRQPAEHHLRAIADAAYFADAKWHFSIHMAQRFWEASSVNTVNFLPERANDQEYFPALRDKEHYHTFKSDFSDIGNICKEAAVFEGNSQVARNAREAYEQWIRPGLHYVTNERLLGHIVDRISEVSQ